MEMSPEEVYQYFMILADDPNTTKTMLYEFLEENATYRQKKYLDHRNHEGQTLLIYAVIRRNIDFVKVLIANRADCTIVDNYGRTAFHYAVMNRFIEIVTLLSRCSLENGERIFYNKDNDGYFPSYYAVESNDKNLMEIVINDDLSRATVLFGGNCDILKTYATHFPKDVERWYTFGNDIYRPDKDLVSFLGKDVAQRFVMGFSPIAFYLKYEKREIAEMLIDIGINVDCNVDSSSNNPIYIAIEAQNEDTIKFLYGAGCDLSYRRESGQTYVDQLLENYQNKCSSRSFNKSGSLNILKMLLGFVDINTPGYNGCYYLQKAISIDDFDLLTLLFEYGADPFIIIDDKKYGPTIPYFYANNKGSKNSDVIVDAMMNKNGSYYITRPPIYYLIRYGNLDDILRFVEKGLVIDPYDHYEFFEDENPLYTAFQYCGPFASGYGKTIRRRNDKVSGIEVIDFLMKRGFNLPSKEINITDENLSVIRFRKGCPTQYNEVTKSNPIVFAYLYDNHDIIRLLAETNYQFDCYQTYLTVLKENARNKKTLKNIATILTKSPRSKLEEFATEKRKITLNTK